MARMRGPDCAVFMCNLIHNTHREDQCEWHRMTGTTGPDCAVMYKLINTHTHTHSVVSLIPPWEDQCERHRMTRITGPDSAVTFLLSFSGMCFVLLLYFCRFLFCCVVVLLFVFMLL